ncbi:MAG TPA: hypothetical protein VJ302_23355 [Blastocatellia bacterium]|nr:hypothetical protein [Blastocatellia bacterium]
MKVISILGLITAVAAGIGSQVAAINPKYGAWTMLAGAVAAAAGGAIRKFQSGGKAVTAVGIIVAVAGVLAMATDVIPGMWAAVIAIIGTAAGAAGESLFGWSGQSNTSVIGSSLPGDRYPPLLALCGLIGAVSLFSACGNDEVKAIATNVDRVAVLIGDAREIRDELFDQGLIDREEAYKTTQGLVKANGSLKIFREKASQYRVVDDRVKIEAGALASDLLSAIDQLAAAGVFSVKNEGAQAKLNAAIGSIRQTVLGIIDQIKRLKVKGGTTTVAQTGYLVQVVGPRAQLGMSPLALLPLLLAAIRQITDFVARERERTGKTAEEIYADAGVQIDANAAGLLDDLVKYAPVEPEPKS